MEKRSLQELDQAMIEMGMLPASKLINGQPMMRHAGVCDLNSFQQWLKMRHEEMLRMKAGMLVDGKQDSELFEWVMSYHAALSEVLVNFEFAMSSMQKLAQDPQGQSH